MPLLVLEGGRVRRARFDDIVEAVLTIIQLVPSGMVTTYGSIAKLLGVSPRLVGKALAMNKKPIVIPCHRVVMSDGRIGGYSGPGGPEFKRALLTVEGVKLCGDRVDKGHVIDLYQLLGGDQQINTP
ncbi:MAG: MGMT family protein [Desulfurococcales archaeon]|nr:MGMT family protein [Desulfurococcales archaeon]